MRALPPMPTAADRPIDPKPAVPTPKPAPHPRRGFTLIEMLVVIGVILILMVLLAPAFTSLKKAGDATDASYAIKATLEQARSFAMSNNTYTWVGFYEENSSATAPTNTSPPYTGKGRLLMASIYSTDGTKIFQDSDTAGPLPPARFKQIGKLVKIEGIHVTDVGPPPSPAPPLPDKLDGRPGLPYTDGAPYDHYNRISSDNPSNAQVNGDQARFPFSAQGYTFYKTIRFNPRGEANINGTYSMKHVAEIGLVQTHGDTAPTPPPTSQSYAGNAVAIQFTAVGGNFKIYTR